MVDLGPNGNNATQAIVVRQPLLVTGAVQFDGVDDTLEASFTTTPQPTSYFWVAEIVTITADTTQLLFDSRNGTNRNAFGWLSVPGEYFFFAGNLIQGSPILTVSRHIYYLEFNGASSRCFIDGGSTSVVGDAGSQSMGFGLTIGGKYDLTTDFGNIRVFFGVAFDRIWGLVDINRIGSHLGKRYGVNWTPVT